MFRTIVNVAQIPDLPFTVVTHAAEETRALGRSLASLLRGGDIVLLTGTLGTGKSEFSRGIAEALGASRWRGSPTFNLIHQYRTSPMIAHVDLYRLEESEVEDLGLEDYLSVNSILLVEWADRAWAYLCSLGGDRALAIDLAYHGEDERTITVAPLQGSGFGRDGAPA